MSLCNGTPLPRRRNGKQQACEPCRKGSIFRPIYLPALQLVVRYASASHSQLPTPTYLSVSCRYSIRLEASNADAESYTAKIACDHTLPACDRCKRRRISDRCVYVDAPMTRNPAAPTTTTTRTRNEQGGFGLLSPTTDSTSPTVTVRSSAPAISSLAYSRPAAESGPFVKSGRSLSPRRLSFSCIKALLKSNLVQAASLALPTSLLSSWRLERALATKTFRSQMMMPSTIIMRASSPSRTS